MQVGVLWEQLHFKKSSKTYSTMKYSKECFWSVLDITVFWDEDVSSLLTESFALLDDFENKYSRFISGNMLDALNTDKSIVLPSEIISLIELCQKVSGLTQGHFDITIQPVLENSGYGISEEKISENIGYENIFIDATTITLKNDVQIEFWSFGKWYALDLLYNSLIEHTQDFVINFGWDIRVAGNHTVHLEDPLDTSKMIWKIWLSNTAIASSSGNKRKIAKWHHLMNAKTKTSQDDKHAVYVTHELWVFADIFATALFVSPMDISLKVLGSIEWLEALIIGSDGKVFKSVWFDAELTL